MSIFGDVFVNRIGKGNRRRGYDPKKDLRPSGGPPSRPISGLPKVKSKGITSSATTDEGLKTRRQVRVTSPARSYVKPTQPTRNSPYEIKEPVRPLKHTPKQATPDNSPKKTKAVTYQAPKAKKEAPKAIVQGNWNTGGAKTVKKGAYQYRKVGK